MDITDLVSKYFDEIDRAIEALSNLQEQRISHLPSWVLGHKRIQILFAEYVDYYIVAVEHREELEADFVTQENLRTPTEVKLEAPWTVSLPTQRVTNQGFWFGDMAMVDVNNPYASPAFEFRGLIYQGSADTIEASFSVEKARELALEIWHEAVNHIPRGSVSIVRGLQNLITRLRDITKLKGFKERRVHRYINAHPQTFLPEHEKTFFEHPLYLAGEKRVADFILQRGNGQPPLLIELENPVHKVFTRTGDLTKEANHARRQITDWVRFIRENSDNAKGEMQFLSGPVDRLVIMGRGLERYQEMLETRYGDTLIWTYDVLAKFAVDRWNRIIAQQCDLLQIEDKGALYRGKLH